jgi:hypothetical protein
MSLNKPDHSMISDLPASVTTDTANADNISSGVMKITQGGTGTGAYTEGQILVGESDGSLGKYQLVGGTNMTVIKSGSTVTITAAPAGDGGSDGSPGVPGANGATGATGSVGPSGNVGATGATGMLGASGPSGGIGATGATGLTGATGPGGIGATGVSGQSGAAGATGPVGATGPAGTNGATGATGVSVDTMIARAMFIAGEGASTFGPISWYTGPDILSPSTGGAADSSRIFVFVNGLAITDFNLISKSLHIFAPYLVGGERVVVLGIGYTGNIQ